MHSFAELAAVHETLERLIARGLIACLERRPGQKEDRYAQLLEDREAQEGNDGAALATRPAPAGPASGVSSYTTTSGAGAIAPVDGLEGRVARLEREVAELRARLGAQEHQEEPPELSSDAGIDVDTDTVAEIDPEPSTEPSPEPATRAWS